MSQNSGKIFQVNAFTRDVSGGNPAAVVPLSEWPSAAAMQRMAAEQGLPATAFFVCRGDRYSIRWFSPVAEIELCGHATLATAAVLWNVLSCEAPKLEFETRSRGVITARRDDARLVLDLAANPAKPVMMPDELRQSLGPKLALVDSAQADNWLLCLADEAAVRAVQPDFSELARLSGNIGVMVTAPGEAVDFVSRFFIPGVGVNEDQVTGSAHATLAPYWGAKLGRDVLTARQLSARGGTLHCRLSGNRVELSGDVVIVSQ